MPEQYGFEPWQGVQPVAPSPEVLKSSDPSSAPNSDDVNWDILKGGQSTLGNPADLGPYRGLVQQRGATYDTRANAQYDWAKRQFDKNAALADIVQKRALDTGSMFTDWAKTDRGLYESAYVPAMKEQLDFARSYTTP